jgi:hypothetical protein
MARDRDVAQTLGRRNCRRPLTTIGIHANWLAKIGGVQSRRRVGYALACLQVGDDLGVRVDDCCSGGGFGLGHVISKDEIRWCYSQSMTKEIPAEVTGCNDAKRK